MNPAVVNALICAAATLAGFCIGKYFERDAWTFRLKLAFRDAVAKTDTAVPVEFNLVQLMEFIMATKKTATKEAAEGVFLVTSVTPEQTFPSQEAADKRAAELAEQHPNIVFHVFESVDNVVSDGAQNDPAADPKTGDEA